MSRTVTGQEAGQKEPTGAYRFVLSDTHREWLKASSRRANRSMSGQLRALIEAEIEREERAA